MLVYPAVPTKRRPGSWHGYCAKRSEDSRSSLLTPPGFGIRDQTHKRRRPKMAGGEEARKRVGAVIGVDREALANAPQVPPAVSTLSENLAYTQPNEASEGMLLSCACHGVAGRVSRVGAIGCRARWWRLPMRDAALPDGTFRGSPCRGAPAGVAPAPSSH